MTILVYILLGLVGLVASLMIAMRVALAIQVRKRRGQPAPKIEGVRGEQMQSGKTLFYFHSPGCGACRSMTPMVDVMSKEDDGVFSVDISKDMDTARKFGVMATPTTVFVNAGIVEEILIGPQPATKLKALMA